jgi:hypothetical protein
MSEVGGDVANDNHGHRDDQFVPSVDCVTEALDSDDDGIDGRPSNCKKELPTQSVSLGAYTVVSLG